MKNPILVIHRFLTDLLQAYVNRKVEFSKTTQLERVAHKAVALPYVLLENHSFIFNHFIIPICIKSVRLEIWNGQVMVGRVLSDNPVWIRPFGKKKVRMEVRLSHITALFNLLRYVVSETIEMDLRGKVIIGILWMEVNLDVKDRMPVPREKFQLLAEPVGNKPNPTTARSGAAGVNDQNGD